MTRLDDEIAEAEQRLRRLRRAERICWLLTAVAAIMVVISAYQVIS